jgi:hypothetical protein
MVKPTIQFVDYFVQTHDWTDTDVISSYKEVYEQLNICQEKLRGGQKNLRKNSLHFKQIPQKFSQIFFQSRRGNNNVTTIGNINKQLEQDEESVLRTEEEHLIRVKNALWRRMGLSIGCKCKHVSTKILKW